MEECGLPEAIEDLFDAPAPCNLHDLLFDDAAEATVPGPSSMSQYFDEPDSPHKQLVSSRKVCRW